MNIIVCGTYTTRKKPCKCCKYFFLWGVSYGHCSKKNDDVSCNDHCKYYKRDSTNWYKNGKCKVNENELYA